MVSRPDFASCVIGRSILVLALARVDADEPGTAAEVLGSFQGRARSPQSPRADRIPELSRAGQGHGEGDGSAGPDLLHRPRLRVVPGPRGPDLHRCGGGGPQQAVRLRQARHRTRQQARRRVPRSTRFPGRSCCLPDGHGRRPAGGLLSRRRTMRSWLKAGLARPADSETSKAGRRSRRRPRASPRPRPTSRSGSWTTTASWRPGASPTRFATRCSSRCWPPPGSGRASSISRGPISRPGGGRPRHSAACPT